MSKKIRCPQCGSQTQYSLDNEFRPFCSKRCKMIDLGTWADEGYKVPVEGASEIGPDSGWNPETEENGHQNPSKHLH